MPRAKKSVTRRARVGTNRRLGQTRLTSLTPLTNSSRIVTTSGCARSSASDTLVKKPIPKPARTLVRIVSMLLDDRFPRSDTLKSPSQGTIAATAGLDSASS